MLPKQIKVLFMEDDPDDVVILRDLLRESTKVHLDLESVGTLALGLERLEKGGIDVILLDLNLPDSQGLEGFRRLEEQFPGLPVIILSGLADEQMALDAVHAGAQDYLVKGQVSSQLLVRAISYAIERTQAQLKLAETEAQYRGIIENSVTGIFQTTPDGHYLSANPALVRMYGYHSKDEMLTRMTDIAHQLYVDESRRDAFIKIMQEKGQVTNFESQIYRQDKSTIWISEHARAVRDMQGRLLYYEGIVEDITERKRAEELMRFSERRFRSVWESANDGMRLTDAGGKILAVNPAYCRIVGMTEAELIGQPYTAIYGDSTSHEEMMRRYRERFNQRSIEQRLERRLTFRSGRTLDLESFNSYVEYGDDTLVLGVFHDVTERKAAEERERRINVELAKNREELHRKNEVMQEDLRMAREIQIALLPQQYPSFPPDVVAEKSLLRFYSRYQPSGEVGGDFFNILPLSATEAGVFICDVLGHGVRSALVTAMIRGLVEELRPIAAEPGLLMSRINHDLYAILQQTNAKLFTTAFYLVADLKTRTLAFANAGHPKPLLLHRRSGHVEFMKIAGKSQGVLGLFSQVNYQAHQADLQPEDAVVLYTDGIYEVEDADGNQFSQEMLAEVVHRNAHLHGQELLDRIFQEVSTFSVGKPLADDTCVVIMEVGKF